MLARQMTHSTTTADRYYAVNSKLEEKSKVAEYIEALTLPESSGKKSQAKKITILEEDTTSESEIEEEGDKGGKREESVRETEQVEDRDEEEFEPRDEEEFEPSDEEEIEVEGGKGAEDIIDQETDDVKQCGEEKQQDDVEKEGEEGEVEKEKEEEKIESEKEELSKEATNSKEDGLSLEEKKELVRVFGTKHLGKGIVTHSPVSGCKESYSKISKY